MEGEVADNNDKVGSDCSWNDKMMSSSCHSLFSKSQYGQVIFHDLYEIYPTDSDITFRYSVTESVRPMAGDKLCLFKVGWNSPNDYLTSRLVSSETISKGVTFPVDTLPKDENNLYQICYITSGNVTAGASLPFRFKKPNESELIATEDPSDPDLLVFKSQFSRMQENMSRVQSEKETMEREIDLLKVRLEQALRELKVYETREEMGTYYDKDLCGDNYDDIYPSLKNDQICEPVNSPHQISLHSNEGGSCIVDAEKEKMLQQILELKNKVKVLEVTLESREQDLSHTNNVLLRSYVKDKENLMKEKKGLEERLVELSLNHNESVAKCCSLKDELQEAQALFEGLFEEIKEAHPRVPTGQDVITSLSKKLNQAQLEVGRVQRDYNDYVSSSCDIVTALEDQLTTVETSVDNSVPQDKFRETLKKKADVSDLLVQTRYEKELLEKAVSDMKEDNAALRSRLNVMEIELRAAKSKYEALEREKKIGNQLSPGSAVQLGSCISETGKLNSTLTNGISKLEQAVESIYRLSSLQDELNKYKKENEELKERLEYLMSFQKEIKPHTTTPVTSATVENLQKALNVQKQQNASYKNKIDVLKAEKKGLQSQLTQLRQEMIGKVSVFALKPQEK